MDWGQQADMTFAQRFARENSNDRAEKLNLETAKMIIYEWKVFMYAAY